MKRAVLVTGIVAAILAGIAVESVRAQARSSGSGFGSSGTSTVSSSGLGASSLGSSFGASSGTGTAATGFGQSILGLSAGSSILGTGTGGIGGGTTGFGGGGSAFGQTGGAAGNANVGIGALSGQLGGYNALGQTGTTGQFGGQTGGLGLTGTTGRGGQANRGGQGQFGQQTGQVQNAQPQVPVRLRLGFTPQRVAPSVIASNLQSSLQQIVSDRRLGSAQVAIDGGVTVITGRTASESQRRLIETIVSMQPGVATIRNEIVVAPEDESGGN